MTRDLDTRRKVIDAAIQCILEEGYYRASSNAIAERAGMTWGVIQHHFGTREALMLAVLEEGTGRLVDSLAGAVITGAALPDRIEQYIRIVEDYYADPEYLAFVQVLLNLSHDPRTSSQSLAAIEGISERVDAELRRLADAVFGNPPAEVRSLVFHVLRGVALSEVMLGSLPFDPIGRGITDSQRRTLAEALATIYPRRRA
jgi:TetR/AcrR family transcriptional regulator, regulator of cefoperazone and chloramphenicol sensitivity